MFESLATLGFALLPWAIAGLLLLGLVVILVHRAMATPGSLMPVAAGAAVIGCGPFLLGLTILDELLLAALVLTPARPARALRRPFAARASEAPRSTDGLAHLHTILFALLAVYFVLQALRGAAQFADPLKLRWVLFFGLAGLLALRRPWTATATATEMRRTLTVAWLVYLVVYIGWGLHAEWVRGISRYAIQPGEWGTPSYTLAPLAVCVPAALMTMHDPVGSYRRAAVAALGLTVLAAFYYDARAGVLALSILVLASLITAHVRSTLLLVGATVVALWFFTSFVWSESRNVNFFLRDTFTSGSALWAPEERRARARDSDRVAHLQVGLTTIQDGPVAFLFGHGYRSSGEFVSDRLRAVLASYGTPGERLRGTGGGTEAFTALMLETGVIGAALVIANIVLAALRATRAARGGARFILAAAGALVLGWTVIINVLDTTWFFLALMPNGILVLLGQPEAESVPAPRKVAPARVGLPPGPAAAREA